SLSASSTIARPRRAPLFPYTPLFRSSGTQQRNPPLRWCGPRPRIFFDERVGRTSDDWFGRRALGCAVWGRGRRQALTRLGQAPRSEEHTSELQSRENLVCRLLLEKKN